MRPVEGSSGLSVALTDPLRDRTEPSLNPPARVAAPLSAATTETTSVAECGASAIVPAPPSKSPSPAPDADSGYMRLEMDPPGTPETPVYLPAVETPPFANWEDKRASQWDAEAAAPAAGCRDWRADYARGAVPAVFVSAAHVARSRAAMAAATYASWDTWDEFNPRGGESLVMTQSRDGGSRKAGGASRGGLGVVKSRRSRVRLKMRSLLLGVASMSACALVGMLLTPLPVVSRHLTTNARWTHPSAFFEMRSESEEGWERHEPRSTRSLTDHPNARRPYDEPAFARASTGAQYAVPSPPPISP